jgi:uncharacterized SAM-binding protein YcdF (DUF218 family)
MQSDVIQHAGRLWNYLRAGRLRAECDAIVVCCSYDLRVCDYACDLLRQGLAPQLILTGKTGNWTRHLWKVPEAQVFRDRALQRGVDPSCIRLEEEATNFGENIANVRRLLPGARRVTFVTKPNSVLRVALTVPIQWPGLQAYVDSPALEFPGDVSQVIGLLGVMHEMVGDVDRIERYPARGFQIEQLLPSDIIASRDVLVAAGFTDHLLSTP